MDHSKDNQINYVEFAAQDLESTKRFFSDVFSWTFKDFGPDYTFVLGQGLEAGFYRAPLKSTYESGGALVVLYSHNLEAVEEKVKQCGGQIVKAIFEFPGGRRFQFTEPSGNELAVWSDK